MQPLNSRPKPRLWVRGQPGLCNCPDAGENAPCVGSVYNLVSKVSFSAKHLFYYLFCCLNQQAANQDVGSVYVF